MHLKRNLDYTVPFVILIFFSVLIFSGISIGFFVGFIFNEFSFRLIKISFINSLFLSIGFLLNFYFTQKLMNHLNKFFVFVLSFFIILGVNFIGLIIVFLLEPIYIFFKINFIYSYVIINLVFIISLTVFITGFLILNKIIENKNIIINKEKKLRVEVEEKLYKSKVNPHFLFNCLNLIVSLLDDIKKAEQALFCLSDLLRYNLDVSELKSVPVNKELEIIDKYLTLQKLRFEDKLDYQINCKINDGILPLVLQPMVENCIKHNINHCSKLSIKIDVIKEKSDILIKIFDSLRKLDYNMIGNGTGLLLTKKRVELANGTFNIINGGVIIKFR